MCFAKKIKLVLIFLMIEEYLTGNEIYGIYKILIFYKYLCIMINFNKHLDSYTL